MLDFVCIYPRDSDHFVAIGQAGGYGNGGTRYFQKLREESNACLVGFSVNGRRCQFQLERVSQNAGDTFPPRFGMDSHSYRDAVRMPLYVDHFLVRSPKIAVPTRTHVEPSSIAISKSCDMPIDSSSMLIPEILRDAMLSRSLRNF